MYYGIWTDFYPLFNCCIWNLFFYLYPLVHQSSSKSPLSSWHNPSLSYKICLKLIILSSCLCHSNITKLLILKVSINNVNSNSVCPLTPLLDHSSHIHTFGLMISNIYLTTQNSIFKTSYFPDPKIGLHILKIKPTVYPISLYSFFTKLLRAIFSFHYLRSPQNRR